ncbi:MAG: M56 family metallopeptidase [Planctomycetota bacterium]|nr:M56 family metallopeptidase [Planctomycetota bacterium]
MSLLESFASLTLVHALGWTLLHFLWEGALVAAAIVLLLALLRRRSAAARYLACCAGMMLMIAVPAVTLITILNSRSAAIAVPPELLAADPARSPIWDRLSPLLPYLTLFWLAGVLLLQCRLVLQWSRAQHLKHYGTRTGPAQWRSTVLELSQRLRVGKDVRIVESMLATGPMVLGWLRPVILLPAGIATGLTPEQLRTVIAHELAHVRRHDYVVNLIQSVCETLLFYHPAVWWLSQRMRIEREYCCDDLAVSACGDAVGYARALTALDAMRAEAYPTALATTGGPLMNRILRVVGLAPKAPQRAGGWLAPMVIAASIIAAASVMVFSPGAAAEEKIVKDPPPKKVMKIERDVDLVVIAKKLGVKRADVLADLQAAGLDNEALMIVLREIEPDKNVVKKVEHFAQDMAVKKVKLSEKEKKLIEKMKADGASDQQIKEALAKLRAKYGNPPVKVKNPKAEYIAYEKQVIKKMKAEGKSDEEIKKTITKMRAEFKEKMVQTPPPETDKVKKLKAEYVAYEEKVIRKMKADGATKEEVKKTVSKMRAEFQKKMASLRDAPPPKKKVSPLSEKERALIEKMKAAGMSKEEITRVLAELKAKQDAA